VKERMPLDADGFVAVPTGPGLGIELDEEVLERYRVS
jgi:L-alanine-DL-glutamate epimerase-like enolase superfamily enzyme